MCIQITGNKQVAEQDIVCWKFGKIHTETIANKIVDKVFESWVYNFKYELGKKYKNNIVINDNNGSEGFHSIKSKDYFANSYSWFHSIKSESYFHKTYSFDVVRCIIPKGATYYEGISTDVCGVIIEEFISDEIIVVERRINTGS